jgi:hypothetical protein
MKKSISAVLLVLATIPVFALDLTPHEIVLSNDGPPVKRYFFQDGSKRFSFRIDNKMSVNGGSEAATFQFADTGIATMKLAKSQLKPGLPFDQKNLEAYRAAAGALLPADAANVQVEEKRDAIPINGWASHQFVFTYNAMGLPFRRSVTFVNFSEKEQIIFDLSALAPDYEKIYARGYRVLNSLSDLPPTSTQGPT